MVHPVHAIISPSRLPNCSRPFLSLRILYNRGCISVATTNILLFRHN